jgi:hypothetical protein
MESTDKSGSVKIAWKFDCNAARRKFGDKKNSFTRSETYWCCRTVRLAPPFVGEEAAAD